MYKVRNETDGPIVISEWGMFIAGKKTVDLEITRSREDIERSKELKQLVANGHMKVVEKTPYITNDGNELNEELSEKVKQLDAILGEFKGVLKNKDKKPESQQPEAQSQQPQVDLNKFLEEVKNIVSTAQIAGNKEDSVEYTRDADNVLVQKLVDAKLNAMSKKNEDLDSNFEELGQKTVKKSNVNDLLKELEQ